MRLILVRHGDSGHSQADHIQGRSGGLGLTELGIRQAEALAKRFQETQEGRGASLLSSPMTRTCQTADILTQSLQAESYETDSDLCEIFAGEAEGLSGAEYRQRYGEFDLSTYPQRPFSPGGESFEDFLARVRAAHERYAARNSSGTIVAVTHAGFIVASFLSMFGIPRPGTGVWIDPLHTGLTEWEYNGQAWRLVRYNDTAHYAQLKTGSDDALAGGLSP